MARSHRGPRLCRAGQARVLATLALAGLAACGEQSPIAPPAHAAGATLGAVIVASPTGTPGGAGTAAAPVSLERAIAAAPTGATIQLQSGEYATGGLVVTRPMTIVGAPGAKVTLRGSEAIAARLWERHGSTWRTPFVAIPRSAVSVTSSATSAARSEPGMVTESDVRTAALARIDPAHLVSVDGRTLAPVGSASALRSGTYYVDSLERWLYVADDPSTHAVSTATHDIGMTVAASGVTISSLTFDHFAQVGVRVGGSYVTINHADFSYNGVIGLDVNAASHLTVENSRFIYNGQVGIEVSHSSDLTFAGNNISNNNTHHYNVSQAAAGIKGTDVSGVMVRNNWVSANASNAVWFDVNSSNITIANNTVLNNQCFGIYFELASGALVVGNIVHDNTSGIGIHFTRYARLYNNTLVNNGTNLDVSASYYRPPWDLYHTVIVNNILWNARSMLSNLYRYNGCNSTIYSEVDYNAYYRPSGSSAHTAVNWCNRFYGTATSYHYGTGYEAHRLDYNGGGDPFFVNVWGGDYRLRWGSPAVRRGQGLPSDAASALGVRAWTSVNMGAIQ